MLCMSVSVAQTQKSHCHIILLAMCGILHAMSNSGNTVVSRYYNV